MSGFVSAIKVTLLGPLDADNLYPGQEWEALQIQIQIQIQIHQDRPHWIVSKIDIAHQSECV
jgi:hypothetical protein